jgi:hypothetical protein
MIKTLHRILLIFVIFILSACTNSTVGGGSNATILVNAPRSVTASLGLSSNATIIFSAPQGAVITGFTITNGLANLPSGWSSSVKTFSCTVVFSAGNACSLTLTFSPTSANQKGTLTLNFRYNGQTTGSVSIPYFVSSSSTYTPSTQFGVKNNCPYTVWFQYTSVTPLTDAAIVTVAPGASYDYNINGQFVNSFRAWPKTGCDGTGNSCTVGQSTGTAPQCPNGCAPAVDSKFEGTFNAPGNSGVTSYDGSLVDGFTLPFSIVVTKATNETNASCLNVDASNINYTTSCPTTENVSTPANQMAFLNNQYGNFAFGPFAAPSGASLTSVNLMVTNPNNGQLAGCYSPGNKLTFPNNTPGWGGIGIGQGGTGNPAYYSQAIMYSCAFTSSQLLTGTAPNLPAFPDNIGFTKLSGFCNANPGYCTASNPNGPAATQICRGSQAGTDFPAPVPNTQYVTYVHANTSNLYAYAYDDTNGGLSCNQSQTKYAFITCP